MTFWMRVGVMGAALGAGGGGAYYWSQLPTEGHLVQVRSVTDGPTPTEWVFAPGAVPTDTRGALVAHRAAASDTGDAIQIEVDPLTISCNEASFISDNADAIGSSLTSLGASPDTVALFLKANSFRQSLSCSKNAGPSDTAKAWRVNEVVRRISWVAASEIMETNRLTSILDAADFVGATLLSALGPGCSASDLRNDIALTLLVEPNSYLSVREALPSVSTTEQPYISGPVARCLGAPDAFPITGAGGGTSNASYVPALLAAHGACSDLLSSDSCVDPLSRSGDQDKSSRDDDDDDDDDDDAATEKVLPRSTMIDGKEVFDNIIVKGKGSDLSQKPVDPVINSSKMPHEDNFTDSLSGLIEADKDGWEKLLGEQLSSAEEQLKSAKNTTENVKIVLAVGGIAGKIITMVGTSTFPASRLAVLVVKLSQPGWQLTLANKAVAAGFILDRWLDDQERDAQKLVDEKRRQLEELNGTIKKIPRYCPASGPSRLSPTPREPSRHPASAGEGMDLLDCLCLVASSHLTSEFVASVLESAPGNSMLPGACASRGPSAIDCWAMPYGPDDAPRRECDKYKDNDSGSNTLGHGCGNINCGPDGQPIPVGTFGCVCVSGEPPGGAPCPQGEVINCGPDAIQSGCDCVPLGAIFLPSGNLAQPL